MGCDGHDVPAVGIEIDGAGEEGRGNICFATRAAVPYAKIHLPIKSASSTWQVDPHQTRI